MRIFISLLMIAGNILFAENAINLVPIPQKIIYGKNNFKLAGKLKLYIENYESFEQKGAVNELKESLSKKRVTLELTKNYSQDVNISAKLESKLFEGIPLSKYDEAYQINIEKSKIDIRAATKKGLFNGFMTLIQIIDNSDKIPECKIIDYPMMSWRSISDDISRGQVPNMETYKKTIRFMARYKLNIYMPYIEDMFEFTKYPSIGKNRGKLSKSEAKELVEFAKQYNVMIVPIFECLGHFENILNQKEFVKYAEFPGAASLSIANDSTIIFIEDLIKELCEVFPAPYFNMGADESYDVGLGATKSMIEKAPKGKPEIYARYYSKIDEIIKKYGKKSLIYSDEILRHPETLDLMPKDVLVVDWHYGLDYDYKSVSVLNQKKFNFLVSPSVWNYVSTYPNQTMAIPNIFYFIRDGLNNNALGMVNSNWGDYGGETFKELVYYGYALSAACSWNMNSKNEGKFINEFSKSFLYDFYGTKDRKIVDLFDKMANPFNNVGWNESFRHPLLPFRVPDYWQVGTNPMAKITWLRNNIPIMLEDLSDLKKNVGKNSDNLDFLEYVCRFNLWYSNKLECQMLLQRAFNQSNYDETKLNELIETNIEQIKNLKEDYCKLWTRYYKKENLNMICDKFDRLTTYFIETRDKLAKKDFSAPDLKSKWIYCQLDTDKFACDVTFKKIVDVEGNIHDAKLQIMGDSHNKIYINGKLLDSVYTRRSLSLFTEYKRVKYINIAEFLRQGQNEILVNAKTWEPNKGAGTNIIARIITDKKEINVVTDDTWNVKDNLSKDEWKNAKILPYKYVIINPNFDTNRPSWIER